MSFTESIEDIVAASDDPILGKHASWKRVRVSEIAEILNGFAFPSTGFNLREGLDLIRIRDINETSTETKFSGEFQPEYLVRAGDILIGMDGDFNCSIWRGSEALLNQRVCKVSVDECFYSKKFLYYALPGYLRAINRATSSITVKHLSSRTLQDVPLPLPARFEQDRIVAEIEKQFTRLDAATAALKRVQANLKRYRASVLKAACEGRLVPTEAEFARKEGRDYEPAGELLKRILRERRARWESDTLAKMIAAGKRPTNDLWKQKYKEPSAPDTTNLPDLPEGWRWASAEQVCEFITKGTTPPAEKMSGTGGAVPFVKVYNLTFTGELDFSVNPTLIDKLTHETGLGRSRVFPGDVLMNIVDPPLGKVSIVPSSYPEWNVNQAIAIFRPIEGLERHFLAALFMSDDLLQLATKKAKATAGQFNLTLEICRELPVPLPPFNEQLRIAAALEVQMNYLGRVNESALTALNRGSRLRRSVLEAAFSGQLVPQDPTDEPASALLARIRTERVISEEKPRGRCKPKQALAIAEV